MRRLFMVVTLSLSFIAATGAAHADDGGAPPTCGGSCPWGPDGTGGTNGDPVR